MVRLRHFSHNIMLSLWLSMALTNSPWFHSTEVVGDSGWRCNGEDRGAMISLFCCGFNFCPDEIECQLKTLLLLRPLSHSIDCKNTTKKYRGAIGEDRGANGVDRGAIVVDIPVGDVGEVERAERGDVLLVLLWFQFLPLRNRVSVENFAPSASVDDRITP